jgi:hypothetical protein
MNKRSALMLSAGLVLTLIVGGLAVAAGLTGPSVSTAVPRVQRSSASEPVVRTVRRTVTVHQQAEAKPGEVVQVAGSIAASGPTNTSGTADDDGDAYEDEGEDDDDSAEGQDDHGDDGDRSDHEDEGDDD